MGTLFGEVAQQLGKVELEPELKAAGKLLHAFVDTESYVGEVFSLGYEEALVQIHDFYRQQVGGIPALSFLIATRITPSASVDVRKRILLSFFFEFWTTRTYPTRKKL
jgi:hypothetical protein